MYGHLRQFHDVGAKLALLSQDILCVLEVGGFLCGQKGFVFVVIECDQLDDELALLKRCDLALCQVPSRLSLDINNLVKQKKLAGCLT